MNAVIPSPLFGDIYLADGLTKVTTTTYTLAQLQGMQFSPVGDAFGSFRFIEGRGWFAYIQNGYGAFSIGQSQLNDLCRYIGNQRQHHRTVTFQEEFRKLLERYDVSFDERYVWD